jgi:hypothetical protein
MIDWFSMLHHSRAISPAEADSLRALDDGDTVVYSDILSLTRRGLVEQNGEINAAGIAVVIYHLTPTS